MGNRNCAVVSCKNSSYKLKKWKTAICSTNGISHQLCVCKQPFKLYWFPSKLRNSEQREKWVRAMKREAENKAKWEPKESDRVCSEHFVDGTPTLINPDPTLYLGYEVGKKGTRRALHRNLNQPQKRKRVKTQETSCKYDQNLSVDTSCFSEDLAQPLGDLTTYSESMVDHDYFSNATTTETCLDCSYKGEMIFSLREKLKAQTIKLRKKAFYGRKDGKFSYLKIKSDAKMKFYTGFASIGQFNAVFNLFNFT